MCVFAGMSVGRVSVMASVYASDGRVSVMVSVYVLGWSEKCLMMIRSLASPLLTV